MPGDGRMQVGFIAVDSGIHFFSMPDGVSQPHEMIMLDVEGGFSILKLIISNWHLFSKIIIKSSLVVCSRCFSTLSGESDSKLKRKGSPSSRFTRAIAYKISRNT